MIFNQTAALLKSGILAWWRLSSCALAAFAGEQQLMKLLVAFVLVLHLAWYVWVVFGVFLTRSRRVLTAFHILSLIWGMFEQVSPWGSPLTHLEHFFQAKSARLCLHRRPFVSIWTCW